MCYATENSIATHIFGSKSRDHWILANIPEFRRISNVCTLCIHFTNDIVPDHISCKALLTVLSYTTNTALWVVLWTMTRKW